ncbi:C2HC/C3H-type domain-containing protein [Plasmodiophora brassicae]|uniref:C2HC/C3H-type domain-containing protein n=1 Tax=Plasmodiophora brassicae TaxID=37360 RepID=A0A0G4IWZ7_PLABS|nr:hypothetical protein PBRA_007506 [Plasmodiophora brassicae]SPQ97067.1 unnamed protein product [Plasmodiophora brassicae]
MEPLRSARDARVGSNLNLLKQKLKQKEVPRTARGEPKPLPPRRPVAVPTEEHRDLVLEECGVCGRKFATENLPRHVSICRKASNKTRKVFDPTAMRTQGTEFAQFVKAAAKKKPGDTNNNNNILKPKKWKIQSENLRSAMQSARASRPGSSLEIQQAPSQPTVDPSLIACPHCQRRFNQAAADRHIPKCSTIVNRPKTLQRGAGRGAHQRATAPGSK